MVCDARNNYCTDRMCNLKSSCSQLLPQIASGRLRLATSALLLLIGPAVGFASLLRGSRRFTGGVEKVRMLYGLQSSEK